LPRESTMILTRSSLPHARGRLKLQTLTLNPELSQPKPNLTRSSLSERAEFTEFHSKRCLIKNFLAMQFTTHNDLFFV